VYNATAVMSPMREIAIALNKTMYRKQTSASARPISTNATGCSLKLCVTPPVSNRINTLQANQTNTIHTVTAIFVRCLSVTFVHPTKMLKLFVKKIIHDVVT